MRRKILLMLALCLAWPAWAVPSFERDTLAIHTHDGERRFTVEIAETPEQQKYGLMHRDELPPDHGMLFVDKSDSVMRMWMKNTRIPLDMLFIDRRGLIVYIASNAMPNSLAVITAGKPVRAVLELAGGAAEKNGIREGDQVIHRYFKP
jgi:uncharacterized protein